MNYWNTVGYFLEHKGPELRGRNIGLLCNHVSYDFDAGSYLFSSIQELGNLIRVFTPEHGLFGELQDQIALTDVSPYRDLIGDVEAISLYGESEVTLKALPEQLSDLEILVVDLQDVGSRYYTFATTLYYLFRTLEESGLPVNILLIDRPNPAGRQVEGSPLWGKYESFVGVPGILHRHGLTIGELAQFHHHNLNCEFALDILRIPENVHWTKGGLESGNLLPICPSPNIPNAITPMLYSGQCLLEGTHLSEGRGTTRPFEIFGAPFLDVSKLGEFPFQVDGAILRPIQFIPAFHKHTDEVCSGFQIHLNGLTPYHSLSHTLQILRCLREIYPQEMSWRLEAYEFRSDIPAIALLAGDEVVLDYLEGRLDFDQVQEHFHHQETLWIQSLEPFLLYQGKLFQTGSKKDR